MKPISSSSSSADRRVPLLPSERRRRAPGTGSTAGRDRPESSAAQSTSVRPSCRNPARTSAARTWGDCSGMPWTPGPGRVPSASWWATPQRSSWATQAPRRAFAATGASGQKGAAGQKRNQRIEPRSR